MKAWGYKKIRSGKKYIEAFSMRLQSKNLIILKGGKGYIMCGYLDLSTADKFKDVAVRITGASNIAEAVLANVHSLSQAAKRLGIYKGQPIKEVLEIIA